LQSFFSLSVLLGINLPMQSSVIRIFSLFLQRNSLPRKVSVVIDFASRISCIRASQEHACFE